MCAATASTKYSVNIAVVIRASHGNRPTESRPTAAAVFTTGKTHRMRRGTPRVSRVFEIAGSGMAHATASLA
jgi:hypothetical protein